MRTSILLLTLVVASAYGRQVSDDFEKFPGRRSKSTIVGNVLVNTTPEQCAEKCLMNARCQGFNINNVNGAHCALRQENELTDVTQMEDDIYTDHYALKGPCHADKSPCVHGTCTLSGNGAVCDCDAFFQGSNCDQDFPCESDPCKNGGQCVDIAANNFKCICTPTYKGDVCEIGVKLPVPHHIYADLESGKDLADDKVRVYVSGVKNSGSEDVTCTISTKTGTELFKAANKRMLIAHHHDYDAPDLADVELSNTKLNMRCSAGVDAVYITKIQYRRNATQLFQASVLNVFDDPVTCNTAGMQMDVVRAGVEDFQGKLCPIDDTCVGANYVHDPTETIPDIFGTHVGICRRCMDTVRPSASSPCKLLYAVDEGEVNSLGYKKHGTLPCGALQHSCVKPDVPGRAKCCYPDVDIQFSLKTVEYYPHANFKANFGK